MRVYVIPGVPKLVCANCGAKARAGETVDGKCWKCQTPIESPKGEERWPPPSQSTSDLPVAKGRR